ncbi:MAG: Ig-like domain-containing protein [Eubacteriales bacterium]|nr:Ig-like domain-containing protein [Eubacteriales bacterium]
MSRKILFLLIPLIFTFAVTSVAYALPTAENLEIYTLVNTPAFGSLHADGDGKDVTFYVTTQPVKGELTVDGDGYYRYTPHPNRRGRDYFGFRVKDGDGNVSQEATVIIRIAKQHG